MTRVPAEITPIHGWPISLEHGADGERVRRAIAADHDDAVVALADAAGVVDRARGLALVVIGDHAQLLAEHAALLVDLVDGGLDADLDGGAGVGERAGQLP